MPNRLINETSPYLLQHAHNPVDWYPWGVEALQKAKDQGKPILLSIGYAACHWCHVMERESFENETIATQMNDNFICVKVDREERPELDAIYMQAVQSIAGHGGWPLTVFLTPDAKPFFGGTYFPPEDRQGFAGFPRVLRAVLSTYSNNPPEVQRMAESLTRSIQAAATVQRSSEKLSEELMEQAYHTLAKTYDAEDGGLGGAPKFPQPMLHEFLLRYHHRTGGIHALRIVEHSLRAMAQGGIYDQLGGGFHRYATDPQWLVPHFEKMLYDNALLAQLALHLYQITGDDFYRRVVEETLDYLLRDLSDPSGGFYSSQDADSGGVEGQYYLWNPTELQDLLGSETADLFSTYYGVLVEGNFEGENILHVPTELSKAAQTLGITEEALLSALTPLRAKALDARGLRVPPATDDKVLTGWNALALRVLAQAASVLGDDRYRRAAEANATFLLNQLHQGGRLLRTWKAGHAHLNAYLEDYAFLVLGLLTLHEATSSHRWLHAAKELTDEMLTLFWDDEQSTLFDVGTDHESLVVRPREVFDNALPSGNAAATEALLRMAALTNEQEYRRKAVLLLESVTGLMGQHPHGFGHWLGALDLYLATPQEVAIVGPHKDPATAALVETVQSRFLPNRLLVLWDPNEPEPFATPVLEGRQAVEGLPTAYVCRDYACDLPATDPADLAEQIAR
jgi:uncharacterized protein YyaL (SSP411 family)